MSASLTPGVHNSRSPSIEGRFAESPTRHHAAAEIMFEALAPDELSVRDVQADERPVAAEAVNAVAIDRRRAVGFTVADAKPPNSSAVGEIECQHHAALARPPHREDPSRVDRHARIARTQVTRLPFERRAICRPGVEQSRFTRYGVAMGTAPGRPGTGMPDGTGREIRKIGTRIRRQVGSTAAQKAQQRQNGEHSHRVSAPRR